MEIIRGLLPPCCHQPTLASPSPVEEGHLTFHPNGRCINGVVPIFEPGAGDNRPKEAGGVA